MTFKTLIAAAVAGAFALPLAANAQSDSAGGGGVAGPTPGAGVGATTSQGDSARGTTADTGRNLSGGSATAGASGSVSGSVNFSAIDSNNDGMISRSEWDAYHARGSASGATGDPRRGGAMTPEGAGRGKGDNTQTPGNPNSTQLPSRDGSGGGK